MFIIIGALVYLALIGVAYFFYYRLTKTKGQLFGTLQQLQRIKARYEKTAEAARQAEDRWQLALAHLEASLGNTDKALEVSAQIGEVGQQLHELTSYIMHPLDEPTRQGRHAMPDNAAILPSKVNQ